LDAPGLPAPRPAQRIDTAVRLAGYLVEHARAVFDPMGADPRTDDARWLLDWITRTNQVQFTQRDATPPPPGPVPQGHHPRPRPGFT
jgi:hypothetical protein